MFGLLSPKHQRQLRTGALHELRRSSDLWREYRRRTRFNWLRSCWRFVFWCAFAFGNVFMPACLTMPIIGMGLLTDRGPLAGQTNEPATMLALHVLQLIGVLGFVAATSDRAYFYCSEWEPSNKSRASNVMATVAHLPISDRDLFTRKLLEVAYGAWLIIVWCAMPYGVLAWRAGFGLRGWLIAGILLLLQVVAVISAMICAYGFAPVTRKSKLIFLFLGLAIILISICLGLSAHRLNAHTLGALQFGLYALPTGWVNAAYLHGLLAGIWLGWSWIVPALAMIALAFWLLASELHRGFSIREFIISPFNGKWYGVIENGFRVPAVLPPPPPGASFGREWVVVEALPSAERLDVRMTSDIFRSKPRDAPKLVLDRVCDRVLTPRETLLLSVWSPTYNRLTVQWWVLLALLTGFVVLSVFVFAEDDAQRNGNRLVDSDWFWASVSLVYARLLSMSKPGYRWTTPILLQPVRFEELSWASFKRELMRCTAFAPLMIAYALAMALHSGDSLWQAAEHSLFPLAAVGCAQPIVDCLKLSQASNDTNRFSMWLIWLGGCGAFLTAASVAVFYPSFVVRLVALPLCALVAAGMWHFYRRAYNRGAFDVFVASYPTSAANRII